MKRIQLLILLWVLFGLFTSPAVSQREEKPGQRPVRSWSREDFADLDIPGDAYRMPGFLQVSAQVDTYTIVYFDFEYQSWQGWTQVDNTAQVDLFWHVEDYLEPDLAGLPGPLEGTKSAWCGAPPGPAEYLCSWSSASGYGNNWDQWLCSDPVTFTGALTFSYRGYFHSEPEWDYLCVEYDLGEGTWPELVRYDGVVDTVAAHELLLPITATKLRFRFVSDGINSDEDGVYPSLGAAHIDSIVLRDQTGVLDYEDFESAEDGAHEAGIWRGARGDEFGIYSGLFAGLEDKDPCNMNLSTQIVFFIGSTVASDEYPGLYETPCWWRSPSAGIMQQDEMVVSPVIDLTRYSTARDEDQDAAIPPEVLPSLGGVRLCFTAYRDLPLRWWSLVAYTWRIRNIENGCSGGWLNRGYIYYGGEKEYVFQVEEVGDLVLADSIQVALEVIDLTDPWYGFCDNTPAPWFDNVYVQRYATVGPQWSCRDMDLFQDNFPEEEFNIESWVRADAAIDLSAETDPAIRPGDSIVVSCASPLGGGIAEDAGGPRVYMHVRVAHLGPDAKTPPTGPVLEGTYGHYVGEEGGWTVIQAESARQDTLMVDNYYMFDLDDSLFTRGFMIEYYFEAFDNSGESSTLPRDAHSLPDEGIVRGGSCFFEFTCLPTLWSEILYVDDFHGRGTRDGVVQHYFDDAFRAVVPWENMPDRYDVNNPSSCVSNGPGSRAKVYQMTTAYTTVIWDSGDLERCTISDGTTWESSDKSNDCQLLIDWMNLSEHDCGLWVCGDNIAENLHNLSSPQALELLSTWCGVTLVHDSYFELAGSRIGAGVVNPLVHTVAGVNWWNPIYHPDSFYVYGGCPAINSFDVLGETASQYALRYPDYAGGQYYAAVQNEQPNAANYTVRTLWFGFSYMYIVDYNPVQPIPIVRYRITADILEWFEQVLGYIVEAEHDLPPAWSLSQNFPNPFNPVTTIRYSVREKGRVRLRIYNVAGQLVRTLVGGVKEPGNYTAIWDGRNDRGSSVSSGVYFYEMKAGSFRSTKKMVLLQ